VSGPEKQKDVRQICVIFEIIHHFSYNSKLGYKYIYIQILTQFSLQVWYVSSFRLPFAALLPLDGINACVPHVAHLFVPYSPLRHQYLPPTIPPTALKAHNERYDGYSFEILLAFPLPSNSYSAALLLRLTTGSPMSV
jgi:hypothetical protein